MAQKEPLFLSDEGPLQGMPASIGLRSGTLIIKTWGATITITQGRYSNETRVTFLFERDAEVLDERSTIQTAEKHPIEFQQLKVLIRPPEKKSEE